MRLQVLFVSDSEFRRNWYACQLQVFGIDVEAVVGGVDCIMRMREKRPDVIVLEPSDLWGGSEGILAVRADDAALQLVPIVVLSEHGISASMYHLARYSIQLFYGHIPSINELARSLSSIACKPSDRHVPESQRPTELFSR